jgi:predicted AlkP superfamily phosphohydrolase/phosphomutase
MLTGVNPGMHGIFDFTERLPGRLGVRFINSSRRRYPTFLKAASEQGCTVGSIGLPTTYPPEPLQGYQISGFDTPLPSKADTSYVHPPDLAHEIQRELGGYYFGDFNESRIGRGWHRRVLKKLLQGIERKEALLRFLQRRIPVDLLILHVGETDTVGHHYWSFFDPASPRYVPNGDSDLAGAILTVYRAADELVGHVVEFCRPENVLIVSDHGMGGTSDRVLYLNQFLDENGFFRSDTIPRNAVAAAMKNWGMKWIPYHLQQQAFKLARGGLANYIESSQRFGGIDWSRTLAYSEELNYYPAIWLNLQGREPFGIVPRLQADSMLEEIRSALIQWRDPSDEAAIIRAVHRREEIYQGPEIECAPDLILELNRPGGYGYALGRSGNSTSKTSWRRLEPAEYIGRKGASMNGSHRPYGTFIYSGRQQWMEDVRDLSLLDVAPFALALLGLDQPDWMEKRDGLFPQRIGLPEESTLRENCLYSPRQETWMRRRLSDLGYLS